MFTAPACTATLLLSNKGKATGSGWLLLGAVSSLSTQRASLTSTTPHLVFCEGLDLSHFPPSPAQKCTQHRS